MVKSGLEFFILKFTEPLQSCCCPVPKNLPIRAELAWQVSRYLWRGSMNFKINFRPLFTIIFKAKNVNFKTWDLSPLIEWLLLVCPPSFCYIFYSDEWNTYCASSFVSWTLLISQKFLAYCIFRPCNMPVPMYFYSVYQH